MILYAILIFVMEFILSALLNSNSIAIISRKPWKATQLSFVANALYWTRFFIIAKVSDWSVLLIVASIIGDVLGDWLIASRKPKKRKYIRKTPFSTA